MIEYYIDCYGDIWKSKPYYSYLDSVKFDKIIENREQKERFLKIAELEPKKYIQIKSFSLVMQWRGIPLIDENDYKRDDDEF